MPGHRAVGRIAKVQVAGLGAEMRQVDSGHGIGGTDAKDASRGQRGQFLAGAQDWQGAQKPLAVDFMGGGRQIAHAV